MSENTSGNLGPQNLSVMIIDDDEEILSIVEALLIDIGLTQIVKASDGASALQYFEQKDGSFDLIICDWMMPQESGLDVLRAMRNSKPDIQFIMLTSKTEQQDIATAIDLGTDMYIKKPITPKSFQEKIRFFLTTRNNF